MPITSQKFLEAEARLPVDLRPIYRSFVEQYEFLTQLHYGKGYVAYSVLADLILAGWIDSGKKHPGSRL